MTADKILRSYGFKKVGRFFIKNNRFVIEIKNKSAVDSEKMIYIFVVGKKIVRIGSSKGVLKNRFHAWERDVSRGLQGMKSATPQWEAKEWKKLLEKAGGVVFARQGTKVKTPIGTFPAYLDEESILIGRHLPPLNRSKHR